jgi:hypothetical protein
LQRANAALADASGNGTPNRLFDLQQNLGLGCHGQAFFGVASAAELHGLIAHVFGLRLDIRIERFTSNGRVNFGHIILAAIGQGWNS